MERINRIGLGGVDMGQSNNPSFKRGMLKGLCRTIMAGKTEMSIVCKVVYETENTYTKADRARKEN